MPAITTLFLDIGGVLLTNGWDHEARHKAAETFHLDRTDLDERHHLSFDTYEEGKLSLQDYLNQIVFYEERPFTVDEFKAFIFAQSQPYPEMIQLIRDVKKRYGLKVASVNNEGRELMTYRLQAFALQSVIDYFISSCYVHFRKPDADIFKIALDVSQVNPDEVLYIEDRPLFVQVARSLGINAVEHQNYEATKTILAEHGLAL